MFYFYNINVTSYKFEQNVLADIVLYNQIVKSISHCEKCLLKLIQQVALHTEKNPYIYIYIYYCIHIINKKNRLS